LVRATLEPAAGLITELCVITANGHTAVNNIHHTNCTQRRVLKWHLSSAEINELAKGDFVKEPTQLPAVHLNRNLNRYILASYCADTLLHTRISAAR
jgi:hypothetical protein